MKFKTSIDYVLENYSDGDEIFAFYTMSYNGHKSVSVEEIFIQEVERIVKNNYDLGTKDSYGMKRYIEFKLFKSGVDF